MAVVVAVAVPEAAAVLAVAVVLASSVEHVTGMAAMSGKMTGPCREGGGPPREGGGGRGGVAGMVPSALRRCHPNRRIRFSVSCTRSTVIELA